MPATYPVLYMRAWLVGIAVGVLCLVWLPVLPGLALITLLIVPGLLALRARYAWLAACGGLCAGLAIAAFQGGKLVSAELPLACSRLQMEVSGVVTSLPRVSEMREGVRRQRFELQVLDLEPLRCAGPRRVLLSYYGPERLEPGQAWSFPVRLKRPWGLANPGSRNLQAWYAASKIDALGSASRGARRLPALDQSLGQVHHRVRQALARRLEQAELSARGRAVLLAVTVADKSGLDHGLWTLLQRFGLNHLLVISGLHVGMVALAGFAVGRLLCLPLRFFGAGSRGLPLLLALAVATVYSALAGFSVATQRALAMFLCLVLGSLCRRNQRPADGLFLALLLVLFANSLAPLGSGFWLSFTAVSSLLWLGVWSSGRGGRRGLALRAHAYMALIMLPLGGFWFGGASVVAAPANMLAVPLFGLWVVPLALVAAMLALLDVAAAQWLWQAAAWPLDLCLQLADGAGSGPVFLWVAPRAAALVLAALAAVLLPVPGGGWTRALACLLMLPLVLGPEPPPDEARIHVLDVGQGTAVVVSAGSRTLLYDTGGGNPAGANMAQSVVLPFLRSLGAGRLDTLVISHGDQDHAAGLHDILARMPVQRLWQGGTGTLHPQADSCEAGRAWSWPGGTRFQFLSPAAREGLNSNDASCVLLVQTARGRVLLAGDIGVAQEYELMRYWRAGLRADVLLVGHHGSGGSTSQAWLNRVGPALAILNNAYGNRFGHPHPQVEARLARMGVAQWHTARSGAVSVGFDHRGDARAAGWREARETWWK